jgi:predicted cupin superfamily sugar epimerase
MSFGGRGEEPVVERTVTLGPDLASGHVAQVTVPAGVWQSARLGGDTEALVSCVVSPGFSFEDWRLARDLG